MKLHYPPEVENFLINLSQSDIFTEIIFQIILSDNIQLFGCLKITQYSSEIYDGQIVQYKIIFSNSYEYQLSDYSSGNNSISIFVNKNEKYAHIPVDGFVMRNKNIGIGSYLLSKQIEWLRKEYPQYSMNGELGAGDANTLDEIERRHHFYQNFGFIIKYNDNERKSGKFYIDKIEKLKIPIRNRIVELNIDNYVQLIKLNFNLKSEIKELKSNIESNILMINECDKQNTKLEFDINKYKTYIVLMIFGVIIILINNKLW